MSCSRANALSRILNISYEHAIHLSRNLRESASALREQTGWPWNQCLLYLASKPQRLKLENGLRLDNGTFNPRRVISVETFLELYRLGERSFRGIHLQLPVDETVGACLRDVCLDYANLQEHAFNAANMRGASLHRANLRGTTWFESDLFEANLLSADLRNSWFAGANLSYAQLAGAKLQGAKLKYSQITGASFWGAFYDEDTEWPEGVDPTTLNANLVEGSFTVDMSGVGHAYIGPR